MLGGTSAQMLLKPHNTHTPTPDTHTGHASTSFVSCFQVMTDVFPVNIMEKSNRQKKGSTLGRGGNGDVYKASYKGCVFAVKEVRMNCTVVTTGSSVCACVCVRA